MKKLFVIVITSLLVVFSAMSVSAEQSITVELNGQEVYFDAEPFIKSGRTLVPIRAIAEAMDYDVEWESNTQTITIENLEKIILLNIGYVDMTIQDKMEMYPNYMSIDVPAEIYDDRTYIPLRAVSEAFGADVDWDGSRNEVSIYYEFPQEVEFEDSAVEQCVRSSLQYGDPITENMLLNIYSLSDAPLEEDGIQIHSLEDIRMMPNLAELDLSNQTEIDDINPIAYNENWDCIFIDGLHIEDDSALDRINVSYEISFPNGVGLMFIDENRDYYDALEMYRDIRDELKILNKKYIKDDMSDYEKIKAIHDYLVNNIEYDYDYVENAIENYIDNPLYLALVKGKGECWVYADAFEALCNMNGNECLAVYGDAKGIVYANQKPSWMGHEWNIVNLDGDYYHVDVTWDDPIPDGRLRYTYFLISDDKMDSFNDHRWDISEYPMCTQNYRDN